LPVGFLPKQLAINVIELLYDSYDLLSMLLDTNIDEGRMQIEKECGDDKH